MYLSNEANEHVYFDNFKVTHNRGRIIEENHYYAYGLKIAAISSRKIADPNEGHVENRRQFQGAFNEFDEDIGWNQFELRDYEPQIGRWVQQDPYQEFPSPYTGMGNDPVNNVDPDGGSIFGGLSLGGRLAVGAVGGAIIGGVVSTLSGNDDDAWTGAAIGAGVGMGAALLGGVDWSGAGGAMKEAAPALATTLANSVRQVALEPILRSPNVTPSIPQTAPNRAPLQMPKPKPSSDKFDVSTLTLSNRGVSWIAQHEGVVLKPYNDSKGYATIGIGHLIAYRNFNAQDVKDWAWLDTKQEAYDLFRRDLETKYIPAVQRNVRVPLTQAQFDAVVSFTYNVGEGCIGRGCKPGLVGSNFLRELNNGNYNGNLMLRYRTPSEILKRRKDEATLFNTGSYEHFGKPMKF